MRTGRLTYGQTDVAKLIKKSLFTILNTRLKNLVQVETDSCAASFS